MDAKSLRLAIVGLVQLHDPDASALVVFDSLIESLGREVAERRYEPRHLIDALSLLSDIGVPSEVRSCFDRFPPELLLAACASHPRALTKALAAYLRGVRAARAEGGFRHGFAYHVIGKMQLVHASGNKRMKAYALATSVEAMSIKGDERALKGARRLWGVMTRCCG